MASRDSSDDRDRASASQKPQAPRDDHDENCFIALRRYADEQISSLLHAVTGLPSSAFAPSSRDWLVFHDEELNNALGHWRRHSDDDSDGQRGNYNGSKKGNSSRWPQQRHASHAFPSSVFDSVFDGPFGFGPAAFFRDFSHFHSPFMFDFLAPSTSTAWPIPYLLFSPYSPLHLERIHHGRRHRASDHSLVGWFGPLVSSSSSSERTEAREPRWREAFEDLLRLENGKQMLDDTVVTKKEESGKDWLSGMINRGSLGEGWTHVRSSNGDAGDYFKLTSIRKGEEEQGGPEEDRGGFTELDLYDQFLHQVNGDVEDEEGEPLPASPLMGVILEERRRNRHELEELQKHWREIHQARDAFRRERETQKGESETRVIPDHAPRPIEQSGAVVDVEAKTTVAAPSSEDLASRLVSTVTKTERRTLQDGTVRSRTTVSKRFADGREENYENEEVNDNNHNQPSSTGGADDKSKGGWFWKE